MPPSYLQQLFAAIGPGETTLAAAQTQRASLPALARAAGILAKVG